MYFADEQRSELELSEHGFFLVELEVDDFVIHYTFPAFLDFLTGKKPGHYGEREGCYAHGMNKKISCLRMSHTLLGAERHKFKPVLYLQTEATRLLSYVSLSYCCCSRLHKESSPEAEVTVSPLHPDYLLLEDVGEGKKEKEYLLLICVAWEAELSARAKSSGLDEQGQWQELGTQDGEGQQHPSKVTDY
ncbi:hypothetical protein WISP_14906 [Willisornis vidua]|uniref:Uncharacterized protein n=1 Tax=Willisornis vidua TaxID=1566151 RepID=A0ABQ9DQ63_9PASS|nr:hypothetical protein WISP_14906 [Willisornis vidua]